MEFLNSSNTTKNLFESSAKIFKNEKILTNMLAWGFVGEGQNRYFFCSEKNNQILPFKVLPPSWKSVNGRPCMHSIIKESVQNLL